MTLWVVRVTAGSRASHQPQRTNMTKRKPPHQPAALRRLIKTAALIGRVQKHALGVEKMSASELRAAQQLLTLAHVNVIERNDYAASIAGPTHEELLDSLDDDNN
jgi:hypothetical protein